MYSHMTTPAWRMVVDEHGGIWQGRSEWFFVPTPADPQLGVRAPPRRSRRRRRPTSRSPTPDGRWRASRRRRARPPRSCRPARKSDEGTIRPDNLLRCTLAARTVELPPDGDPRVDLFDVGQLTWLANDPPVFSVEEVRAGMTAIVSRVFYDGGCAPSQTLDAVEAGPSGVTAIYGAGELRVVANATSSAPCRVARWSRFGADRYWSVERRREQDDSCSSPTPQGAATETMTTATASLSRRLRVDCRPRRARSIDVRSERASRSSCP